MPKRANIIEIVLASDHHSPSEKTAKTRNIHCTYMTRKSIDQPRFPYVKAQYVLDLFQISPLFNSRPFSNIATLSNLITFQISSLNQISLLYQISSLFKTTHFSKLTTFQNLSLFKSPYFSNIGRTEINLAWQMPRFALLALTFGYSLEK